MGQPRKHHYVPRCLLRGFANPQTDEGRLFVLDTTEGRAIPSSPAKAGHQRDYNLVSPATHAKPLVVEDFYAKIEDRAAPVLQQMRASRKLPDHAGVTKVLELVAIQFSRTPSFRTWLEGKFFETFERTVRAMGRNPISRQYFADQQRKFHLPEECWTPEGYLEFHRGGRFSSRTDDDWKIAFAVNHLPVLLNFLRLREWSLLPFSSANEPLIISDAGVGMLPFGKPGPKVVGLARPDTIVYLPVSPQLVFAGYSPKARQLAQLAVRPRLLNSCSFAYSLRQCFSSANDFVIADPDRGPTMWTTYGGEGKFPKLMDGPADLADEYAGNA
jgi:hypothetical protein